MKKQIKIGTLHSLVGSNDGVSIVIDGMIESMLRHMDISLNNLYFLAGLSSIRFNSVLDEIFWHKNEQNKYILKHYSNPNPPADLEEFIWKQVQYAEQKIAEFVEKNQIDLMIIHNSCHPSNFIYAVACGIYFEKRRKNNQSKPHYVLWWHDSHFERDRFSKSNQVIESFLKYIPGPQVDGIIFINTEQVGIAKKYYLQTFQNFDVENFFNQFTVVLPNTCTIPWDWKEKINQGQFYPDVKNFNNSFFKDVGIEKSIEEKGYQLEDMVLLLQHTRIVRRKRIDVAIDYTFQMAKHIKEQNEKKCVVLLVSGFSGDEHDNYLGELQEHFDNQTKQNSDLDVVLCFAQDRILPHREVIVDKKMYQFSEIPEIVAQNNGLGVYFSEVEGYGNNLLEMIAAGLPVVMNEYPIYQRDIAKLGFDLVFVNECQLNDEVVKQGWQLFCNQKLRQKTILHNLDVLDHELNHEKIAERLQILFSKMNIL